MGQTIFVVCRESIEALLVIGILYAWMDGREDAKIGKKWLFAGILAGFGLATLLTLTLIGVTDLLGGEGRTWFEIGMLAFASALIVQMVMWMRVHGRTLKKEIESGLEKSLQDEKNWWGVFFLSMIAVGREGSETVMFLYGSLLQLDSIASYMSFFMAVAIGLALAMVLFYLLKLGGRVISWKWFFRVTEIMLLFLGASLLLTASEKLLSGPLAATDLPSWVYSTMWNMTSVLSDGSILGNLLASLFAYRSQPIGWDLAVLGTYWITVLLILKWQSRDKSAPIARAITE
ncbi:FTR1 family iron permease [Shewanella psychromarinicola]|uniref:FTR1 family iron permease n=1 Tax=Shewanella psychromarinicola TaxID=2487742 RepID=A0A3N4EZG8_9GAMM|nr:FTR1 family protein [Shewanella psychromarinicola]AZG36420.1 FTR1 family iron permease [Shewanella psychromarinicola]MCL1084460.1 FTR1 family protein [Shewanella psychromarinicola]RPA34264.1 FTR1 family iron permease [Shewanella psychromarinicola]